MPDLKPCPFCGGTQAYQQHSGQFWSVWCPDCDTNAVQFWPTAEEAIAAWNRRASPSPGEGRPEAGDGE